MTVNGKPVAAKRPAKKAPARKGPARPTVPNPVARIAHLEARINTLEGVVKKMLVKTTMAELAPQLQLQQQQAVADLQAQLEAQLEQNGFAGI